MSGGGLARSRTGSQLDQKRLQKSQTPAAKSRPGLLVGPLRHRDSKDLAEALARVTVALPHSEVQTPGS